MAHRDIIVVGASAGGVEALQTFVAGLPASFTGSIFITLHFPEHGTSVMPRILTRAGPIAAVHAADGESIVPSRIYIAPPDHHLLIMRGHVRLVRGPKENGNRPAADPMFRSAAVAYGPRVVGVVMTGNLDDGTAGLAAIKRRGGLAIVQDPEETLFPSMPRSAMEHVQVDRVVTVRHLAKVLNEIVETPIPDAEYPVSRRDIMENELAAANLEAIAMADDGHPGVPSPFSCPDCGGVLRELRDGEFVRYRCRVGHAWTGEALLAQQTDTVDEALWTALRALEENASLSRQIAERHRRRGSERIADRFEEQAVATQRRAEVIRAALAGDRGVVVTPDEDRANPRRAS